MNKAIGGDSRELLTPRLRKPVRALVIPSTIVLPSLARLLARSTGPLLTGAMLVAGCGTSEPAADGPKKANDVIAACEAPSLALPDGSCIRPGIPPDGCSEGFEHDGEYGCDPILPTEACGPGMMAVPGDTSCQMVMPCGEGRWGDLPVDATTQYVDGSYAGGGNDGTSDKPWTLVQDAYDAAPAGALVAIAAGRYTENIRLEFKSIRLWGVCPQKVSIDGRGTAAAIYLGPGTDGSVVGGLAITSETIGIGITGATDVKLDRVWIHQTNNPAIAAEPDLGATSIHVRNSLLEDAHTYGIYALGSDISLFGSTIRNIAPRPSDQLLGTGLRAEMTCDSLGCNEASRPKITIERCLVARSHSEGVSVIGADLMMNASVVRGTLPQAADQSSGRGLVIQLACDAQGRCHAGLPSHATIIGSQVADNHGVGIFVAGSKADISTTVVRGTLPQLSDQLQGGGIQMQTSCTLAGCDAAAASLGNISNSLVEGNHNAGILFAGSTATIEHTVARGTLPRHADFAQGVGIAGQIICDHLGNCDADRGSKLTIMGCLVEDNITAGIAALFSETHLSDTVIRRTTPQQSNSSFGDGFVLTRPASERPSRVDNVRIEESGRAGLANFGATVSISRTAIACAAFALVGQDIEQWPHLFNDDGDNACGCPAPTGACKAVSAGLDPPKALQ